MAQGLLIDQVEKCKLYANLKFNLFKKFFLNSKNYSFRRQ